MSHNMLNNKGIGREPGLAPRAQVLQFMTDYMKHDATAKHSTKFGGLRIE